MIKAFASGNGQLDAIAETGSADALRNAVWIDLRNATPDEIGLVQQATGLNVPSEADVSEIETSSRLATRGGALYLSMSLIQFADTGARGVSAGFVLSPDRLITVRFAPSRIFETYAEHLPRGSASSEGSAHIFVGLMEAIVDRQADVLEQVRADLDTISQQIFAMGTNLKGGRKAEDATLRRTLGQLGHIGHLISHVRETQVGAARIVPYVEARAADWLPKALTPRLVTLRQDIASVSDFDTHLNDKLQFLLDATLGFINIAQNNVMKVMAIASVVGIPPVLIAGIYGMNFKNIPEYDWAWGYAWGWGLIILTTLIPLGVFRWRKWI
ncbi:MAG TPA: magnesium transporter [Acetobacteraceae bacterium]|jgi:magnesium transporter|nr:magnesium transporter [Acetobacteraceae bacterium]